MSNTFPSWHDIWADQGKDPGDEPTFRGLPPTKEELDKKIDVIADGIEANWEVSKDGSRLVPKEKK